MIWNRNITKKRILDFLKTKGYPKSLLLSKIGLSSEDLKIIFTCNSRGLDIILKHLNSSLNEIDELNTQDLFNNIELNERKSYLETKIEILDTILDIY